ncbi:hypothetical protein BR93DRAFT_173649 [Coniochaeta sp. PMI_546]|nr:hypothetical protein BR93DRAFT_173649 [Coniochaeta sp. PMI_546]
MVRSRTCGARIVVRSHCNPTMRGDKTTKQRRGTRVVGRKESTQRQLPTGVVFNILPRLRAVVLCVCSGLDRGETYGWCSSFEGQAVFLREGGRGMLLWCRLGLLEALGVAGAEPGVGVDVAVVAPGSPWMEGTCGIQCPAAVHSMTPDWMGEFVPAWTAPG